MQQQQHYQLVQVQAAPYPPGMQQLNQTHVSFFAPIPMAQGQVQPPHSLQTQGTAQEIVQVAPQLAIPIVMQNGNTQIQSPTGTSLAPMAVVNGTGSVYGYPSGAVAATGLVPSQPQPQAQQPQPQAQQPQGTQAQVASQAHQPDTSQVAAPSGKQTTGPASSSTGPRRARGKQFRLKKRQPLPDVSVYMQPVDTSHMVSPPETTLYRCTICQKQSSHASNMRRHIRTHLRLRPYHCRLCQSRFTNACNRNEHELRHLLEPIRYPWDESAVSSELLNALYEFHERPLPPQGADAASAPSAPSVPKSSET
eukprot:m.13623 g.13623  ORF g.13623 m.13623 type:complete len:309 (-) comp5976_c0_seq1:424-1350(-)